MWYMIMLIPRQENALDGAVKEDEPVMTVANEVKTSTVVSHTASLSEPKENEPSELLTNDIIVDKGKRHGCPGHSICLADI